MGSRDIYVAVFLGFMSILLFWKDVKKVNPRVFDLQMKARPICLAEPRVRFVDKPHHLRCVSLADVWEAAERRWYSVWSAHQILGVHVGLKTGIRRHFKAEKCK